MSTLIVGSVVFFLTALAVRSIYKDHKKSKTNGGCSSHCAKCPHAGHCG